MTDPEQMVGDIETGDAWNEDDGVVQVEVRKPLDRVIPVRLSADKWEQIREEARDLGVGPTTLARMWILERLRSRVRVQDGCPPRPDDCSLIAAPLFVIAIPTKPGRFFVPIGSGRRMTNGKPSSRFWTESGRGDRVACCLQRPSLVVT